MASNIRFVDQVSVSSYGDRTGTAVSSSYALSSSYATMALSASYAISASHEIVKEVSSSYADTASFAQSGNGSFSGSFSGSFVGPTSSSFASNITTNSTNISELTAKTGSYAVTGSNSFFGDQIITGNITSSGNISSSGDIYGVTGSFNHLLGDGSQLTNLPVQNPFPFTGDAQITGSLLVSGSSGVDIEANQSISVGNQFKAGNAFLQNDVGNNSQLHLGLGLSSAAAITTQRHIIKFTRNTNSLGKGGNTLLILDTMRDGGAEMKGEEFFTAGDNLKLYFQIHNPEDNYFGYVTRQSAGYFSTNAHRAIGPHDIINPTGITDAGAGNIIYFTSGSNYYSGITLSNEGEVNIPSGSISASYFVGDGSQLTNLPTQNPFPYIGNAQITGSLIVSSSDGTVYTLSGSSPSMSFNDGQGLFGLDIINTVNSSTNTHGAKIKLTHVDESATIYYNNGGGGGRYHDALNFISDTGFVFEANATTGHGPFFDFFSDGISNDQSLRMFNTGGNPKGELRFYTNNGGSSNSMFSLGQYTQGAYIRGGYSPNKLEIGLTDYTSYSASMDATLTSINFYAPVTGSTFTGSFIGDGSQLTGISTDPFPYTGSAIISGSLTITGSLTLSGSYQNTGIFTKTTTGSPHTLTTTEHLVLIDASGGNVLISLPDPSLYPGRQIFFKLTTDPSGNTITLQRQGSDLIDGATTYTDLDVQYESISIISDGGTGWWIF